MRSRPRGVRRSVERGARGAAIGRETILIQDADAAAYAEGKTIVGDIASIRAPMTLSYTVAALGVLIVALCCSDLAAMIPVAGSSYCYVVVSLGRFPALAGGLGDSTRISGHRLNHRCGPVHLSVRHVEAVWYPSTGEL